MTGLTRVPIQQRGAALRFWIPFHKLTTPCIKEDKLSGPARQLGARCCSVTASHPAASQAQAKNLARLEFEFLQTQHIAEPIPQSRKDGKGRARSARSLAALLRPGGPAMPGGYRFSPDTQLPDLSWHPCQPLFRKSVPALLDEDVLRLRKAAAAAYLEHGSWHEMKIKTVLRAGKARQKQSSRGPYVETGGAATDTQQALAQVELASQKDNTESNRPPASGTSPEAPNNNNNNDAAPELLDSLGNRSPWSPAHPRFWRRIVILASGAAAGIFLRQKIRRLDPDSATAPREPEDLRGESSPQAGSTSLPEHGAPALTQKAATTRDAGGNSTVVYDGSGSNKHPPVAAQSCSFLNPITDTVFETTDNFCVVLAPSLDVLESRQKDVRAIIDYITALPLPVKVNFFYNIPKVTAVETSKAAETLVVDPEETSSALRENNSMPLRYRNLSLVLYKGQRKYQFDPVMPPASEHTVDTPLPIRQQWEADTKALVEFFTPKTMEDSSVMLSSDDPEANAHPLVPQVSYQTFRREVLEAASDEHPIVVQVMENSCFLCFLLRPFINSVQSVLQANKVPLTIKRFNIDLNDFPPECPVVRSTPTFVCYRGETPTSTTSLSDGNRGPGPNSTIIATPPCPWKEYKPLEFISRLAKEANLSRDLTDQLEELEQLLQERFRRFGLLTLWNQELRNLQRYHEGCLDDKTAAANGTADGGAAALDEDEYNSIVTELMNQDIARQDNLEENLEHLDRQITSLEADCRAFANMIGIERVMAATKRFDLMKAKLTLEANVDGNSS